MAFEDHFRLSSHAVITNEANQILQVKATYGSKGWGLPGGSIDPGETFHDSLLRECREELGADVEIVYMSGIYYHAHFNSHAAIYRCQFVADNPDIILSDEHDQYAYFDLAELSKVQQQRVGDCLNFDGVVKAASF